MDATKLAIGSAVAALVAATALSHLSPDDRSSMVGAARTMIGGATQKSPATSSQHLIASPQVPAVARTSGGSREVVEPDMRGQFLAAVEVEGENLPVLVDTGATYVALSYEDADRLGIRPMPADFKLPMSTANGRTYAAPVRIASIRLGGIVVHDVPAIVAGRGQLGQTLLGMSFLSRLSSFRVESGRLILAQ